MILPPSSAVFSRPARAGFTLVELLTTVAIIGILAGILIPVLSRVRRSADCDTCMANLRSLGQAMALYANDNKHMLPAPADGGPVTYWRRALMPYVSETNVYQSPFICPVMQRLIVANGGSPGISSYAMNIALAGSSNGESSISLFAVHNPARTILATEAGLGPKKTDSLPYPAVSQSILMYPGNVHDGANNLLFVDGHVVTWEDASRLTVAPYCKGGVQDMWSP